MASSQTNLTVDEQANQGDRTLWQKAEYERKRVGYRKEFKNLCLQHIQLLKRKEALVDFGRLFNVWQIYLKYKKLEATTILQYIVTQNMALSKAQQNDIQICDAMLVKNELETNEVLAGLNVLIGCLEAKSKNLNANFELLDQKIIDVCHDLEEVKNKNAVIHESFMQFSDECPDKPELTGKDFVHVLHEDVPQLSIDKTIISKLAEQIKLNLLNYAHKSELKIELINGSQQKLELIELITILSSSRDNIQQQKSEVDKLGEYLIAKKAVLVAITDLTKLQAIQSDIRDYVQQAQENCNKLEKAYAAIDLSLELDKSHFDYGMLQMSLLNEQEIAELNTFDYRAFKQQESVFKKTYKRNQAENIDASAELERKIAEVRVPKLNRQQKIRFDFKRSRVEIENNINKGKTAAEIEELKAKHIIKYAQDNYDNVLMISAEDEILPVPSTPPPSKFNLVQERNEVIVAIAQNVCESLGVLAMAASPRATLKTPQELAGILDFNDPEKIAVLEKHRATEDKAIENLGKTKTEICKLGEEINQLIKELE